MRHPVFMVALALVATAAAGVAALELVGDDEGGNADGDGGRPEDASGPIAFLFDETYTPGETVEVRIENVGTRAYRYIGTSYAACFLHYFDSSGREFKIPPGTHCDILTDQTIEPGEVAALFTWRLNECVKDRWGCVRSRPLPPDTYRVRGRFEPEGHGKPARAEGTSASLIPVPTQLVVEPSALSGPDCHAAPLWSLAAPIPPGSTRVLRYAHEQKRP